VSTGPGAGGPAPAADVPTTPPAASTSGGVAAGADGMSRPATSSASGAAAAAAGVPEHRTDAAATVAAAGVPEHRTDAAAGNGAAAGVPGDGGGAGAGWQLGWSADDGVLLERRGVVGLLRFARPAVRNALREQDWAGLADLVAEAGRDDGLRALVLTGDGGFFSAGFDLKHRRSGPADRSLGLVARAVLALVDSRKPVVAAVEGGAVGGGWGLALSCDLVVAAEDAFFAPPFVSRGLVPDVGLGWLLARSIGRHRANELILLGERVPAPEARSMGLVQRLAPPGQAVVVAEQLATTLASLPSRTQRIARTMVRDAADQDLEAALRQEWMDVWFNEGDEETRTARRAFLAGLGRSR
jgi:2-(1,2-epoxy-1,2-dihydrophenyl)acetyl-CoA isomerase